MKSKINVYIYWFKIVYQYIKMIWNCLVHASVPKVFKLSNQSLPPPSPGGPPGPPAVVYCFSYFSYLSFFSLSFFSSSVAFFSYAYLLSFSQSCLAFLIISNRCFYSFSFFFTSRFASIFLSSANRSSLVSVLALNS